jgi:hypothetical protein
MNNNTVIAQLDDLQISTRLAKVCTTHSYDLHFWEKDTDFPASLNKSVLIFQLNGISEDDLSRISSKKENRELTIIGFSEIMDKNIVNYFKQWGFHMVIRRKDLLKNLSSLLGNIFNGS